MLKHWGVSAHKLQWFKAVDSAFANKIGGTVLLLDHNTIGSYKMSVNHPSDARVTLDWYGVDDNEDTELLIGLRVNPATGAGYWLGCIYNATAGNYVDPKIYKGTLASLTQLDTDTVITDAGDARPVITFKASIDGADLTLEIYVTAVLTRTLTATDSDYTSGVVAIGRRSVSESATRMILSEILIEAI